jgi:uncharacterized protein YdaU (DUF1376 family)
MKSPPFFPIYPADMLSDNKFAFLSHEEMGACFLLMCWQWLNGSVPDDAHRLSVILKCDNSVITKLYPTLKTVFDGPAEAGQMRNEWLNVQRLRLMTERCKKSVGGKVGMQHRWASDNIVITDRHNNRTEQNRTITEEKKQTPSPTTRKRKPKAYSPSPKFEEAYQLYPRHVAAKEAWDAWAKLAPSGELLDKIMAGISAYALAMEKTPQDKIKHFSSWLNGRRWEDDPDGFAGKPGPTFISPEYRGDCADIFGTKLP